MRWLFVLIFAIALSARAEDQSTSTISREVKDIFDRCKRAVVKIHGDDEHSELSGTGFFIDPTGTIYTAYSVGGDTDNLTVEFDGKTYPARLMMADLRSGIAILKADIATPALPIGKSETMEVATPVMAIGYPLDLPSPVSGRIQPIVGTQVVAYVQGRSVHAFSAVVKGWATRTLPEGVKASPEVNPNGISLSYDGTSPRTSGIRLRPSKTASPGSISANSSSVGTRSLCWL